MPNRRKRKHPARSEEKTIIPEEYNTPNEKRKAKLNGGNNNLDAPVSPALPGSGHSDLDWGFGGDGGAFANWLNLLLNPQLTEGCPRIVSPIYQPNPTQTQTQSHRSHHSNSGHRSSLFSGQNQIRPICNGPESQAKANVFICFMLRVRPPPLASFYGMPQPMNRTGIMQGPHMDAHQAP